MKYNYSAAVTVCDVVPVSVIMFQRLFWLTGYLDEVAGYVPACDVQASRQVGQTEALIHRTDVCHTIARVYHHTGQKA